MISGLELYIKKQKVKKPEIKPQPAAATLPQILKGFNSDKPGWIGGVKKSELGGVFDAGGSRRCGLGVDLAKAERMLFVEHNQKKTEKYINHLLKELPTKAHDAEKQPKHLPPIGGAALSVFCENNNSMARIRNGPGFLKLESFEDDVRLIRLRGPRCTNNSRIF